MVYVRVLCGVRYVSMGVHQKEDPIYSMEDDINGDSHYGCVVQVQVEYHKQIPCLKLAVLCGDNGLGKMCQRVAHP